MPDSTVEDYYDALAESYAENIAESPTRTHLDWPAVRSLLPDVADRRVLDAGCGPGTYAGWLAERGADVVGVDVSREMLDVATEEFGDVASFRRADLEAPLDFADGSFDAVVCQLAFSHLREIGTALSEFARVLGEGGVLVLSTHHPFHDYLVVRDREYPDMADAYGVEVDPEVAVAEDPPIYRETERYEIDWGGGGCPYYRRSLGELLGAVTGAGFAVTDVVEPEPDGAFREEYPEVAAELDRWPPESLCLRAELR